MSSFCVEFACTFLACVGFFSLQATLCSSYRPDMCNRLIWNSKLPLKVIACAWNYLVIIQGGFTHQGLWYLSFCKKMQLFYAVILNKTLKSVFLYKPTDQKRVNCSYICFYFKNKKTLPCVNHVLCLIEPFQGSSLFVNLAQVCLAVMKQLDRKKC